MIYNMSLHLVTEVANMTHSTICKKKAHSNSNGLTKNRITQICVCEPNSTKKWTMKMEILDKLYNVSMSRLFNKTTHFQDTYNNSVIYEHIYGAVKPLFQRLHAVRLNATAIKFIWKCSVNCTQTQTSHHHTNDYT